MTATLSAKNSDFRLKVRKKLLLPILAEYGYRTKRSNRKVKFKFSKMNFTGLNAFRGKF